MRKLSPLYLNQKCANHFYRETTIDNNFNKKNKDILLIRQKCKGYRCESDMPYYKLRVTENYVYDPLRKFIFILPPGRAVL